MMPAMEPLRLFADCALLAAEPGDKAGNRRISSVLYSGGMAEQWGEKMVIDLATTAVAPDVALLFQHKHEMTVGTGKGTNSGREVRMDGVLFTGINPISREPLEPKAQEIAGKSDAGFKYQMSVGVFDYQLSAVPAGATAQVNGQTFNGPFWLFSNGIIREGSIVALGADANTPVHIFDFQGAATMPQPADQLAALTEQVATLTAQVKTITVERDAAAKERDEMRAAETKRAADARKAEITELSAAVGRQFSEATAAAFAAMPADAWAATKAELHAARPANFESLTREHATSGAPAGGKEDPLIADARRRAAFAAKRA